MAAKKSASDPINDTAALQERVLASSRRQLQLISSDAVASGQVKRATEVLRQAQATISTESTEFADIAQLKASITELRENVTFYETRAEDLKDELAMATADNTQIAALFNIKCDQVVELRPRLAANDKENKLVLQNSCVRLGPSIRGMVDNFHKGLNKFMCDAILPGSFDA